ncbi:MAG: TIGR01244 family phosphatase [Sphingomonadaceae bacterium]|nr:TIGR01244 family phosphatase [Sphingomonadaceae bacterium]
MTTATFRQLGDTVYASPQIGPADIAEAAALGVTLVVNNRPDGEAPDEPQGAEIEAAARAAGLDYVAIPVTHAGFAMPPVEAMRAALDGAAGKTLAYCRSGTRSTLLWALTEARSGADPEALSEAAAAAGYDLAPIRAILDAFAADGR